MQTTTAEQTPTKLEVHPPPAQSALIVPQQEWMQHDKQLAIVRRDIAPGLDNDEFEVFKGICRATGLNPIMRQIYAIKRNDKNSPNGKRVCYQTGIDGLRLIADRTGKYAGNDDPIFDYKLGKDIPFKATVTVYKIVSGVRCPFTATALTDEYWPAKGQDYFYEDRPHLMIGKCAEALALRKAFPAETCGMYVKEEMLRPDSVIEAQPSEPIQQPRRAPANTQESSGAHNNPPEESANEGADSQSAPPASGGQDWSVKDNQKWKQGHIESVRVGTSGTTNGKAWTLFSIIANGNSYGTFSETVAKDATEAAQASRPVWFLVEKHKHKLNIIEIRFK